MGVRKSQEDGLQQGSFKMPEFDLDLKPIKGKQDLFMVVRNEAATESSLVLTRLLRCRQTSERCF